MNWDEVILAAPEGERQPLINEEVIQRTTGNVMPVVGLTATHVTLKPCYKRKFTVELHTFWERYIPTN